jgi:hypothetical protein
MQWVNLSPSQSPLAASKTPNDDSEQAPSETDNDPTALNDPQTIWEPPAVVRNSSSGTVSTETSETVAGSPRLQDPSNPTQEYSVSTTSSYISQSGRSRLPAVENSHGYPRDHVSIRRYIAINSKLVPQYPALPPQSTQPQLEFVPYGVQPLPRRHLKRKQDTEENIATQEIARPELVLGALLERSNVPQTITAHSVGKMAFQWNCASGRAFRTCELTSQEG